jgi:glucokinase, proteobacterial type
MDATACHALRVAPLAAAATRAVGTVNRVGDRCGTAAAADPSHRHRTPDIERHLQQMPDPPVHSWTMTLHLLAGDIGGTKSLLELSVLEPGAEAARPLAEARLASGDFPDLTALLRHFLDAHRELGRPDAACLSLAAPVDGGRGRFTNLPWTFDRDTLAAELGLPACELVNDFAAAAHALPELGAADLLVVQPGAPRADSPQLLVGAGTGLGVAWRLPQADGTARVLATEGGHADLAPRDALEDGLLLWLRHRFAEHVSSERALSGSGLAAIYAYLREHPKSAPPESSEVAAALRAGADHAAVISQHALESADPLSCAAIALFLRLYGAFIGNLALSGMPRGGIFVSGGVIGHLLPLLGASGFHESFLAKGRMRPLLESLPLAVVRRPGLELAGARRRAHELAAHG